MKNGSTAISVTKERLSFLKTEAYSNTKYREKRTTYGFYIENMLISCSYNNVQCSTSDFSLFFSSTYGNCYQYNINSSSKKTIGAAGPGYSLEIELFSGDPNEELYTYKRGFYVIVHNQSYTPIIDNEGVYISVGSETNIAIQRNFYSRQSAPFSDCIDDPTSNASSSSELYKLILNRLGEKMYRQAFCYKMCYQLSVVNNCSCYDNAYYNTNDTNANIQSCHNDSTVSCMNMIKSYYLVNGFSSLCDQSCPSECFSVSYTTIVHASTYPTGRYLDLLMQQKTLTEMFSNSSQYSASLSTYIQNSVAKINIFYNDLSYNILIESASITWDVLLGNIGGSLGLFVGISFLSIIELFEIAFETIRLIYNYKKEIRTI